MAPTRSGGSAQQQQTADKEQGNTGWGGRIGGCAVPASDAPYQNKARGRIKFI